MLNNDATAETPGGVAARVSLLTLGKFERLTGILRRMESVVIAFSGGVDSTFLIKAAHDALGAGAAALTATSPTYPEGELVEAKRLAVSIGIRHFVVESNELLIPNFADNTERRCYYCKSELFSIALDRARSSGFSFAADGSNADDVKDYRPGKTAANELGIRSPLQEAGLTKDEIRALSRMLGLPTWNKPSFACLSSRFPYGTRITEERLEKVKRGEEMLRALGFIQFRVRYYGDTARIEVAEPELPRAFDENVRREITVGFKGIGFVYVTLDLEGYRTGSMNEVLASKKA